MFENITNKHSEVMDEIINARHSVKKFNTILPNKDDINQIIQAGLRAPYALFPAIGKKDFRKVIAIPSTSSVMGKIVDVINNRLPKYATEVETEFGEVPYVKLTKHAASVGIIPLLGNTPYLLIAAERKGIPNIAGESLSYCMCNMWLKATSLKIGFRLISFIMTLNLGDDKEFCELLGIPSGEYALDACCLGYADDSYIPNVNYPNFDSNVTWL